MPERILARKYVLGSPLDRLMAHVCPAPGPLPTDCWICDYATAGRYPQMRVGDARTPAHRFMFEHHVGPVPVGLELDHLCEVKTCVNPNHLEPVTHRENVVRWQATHPQRRKRK